MASIDAFEPMQTEMLIWSQTSPTPFLWRQTYSYLPSFEASPPFLKYRIILCTVSEQLARPPSRRKCTQRRQKKSAKTDTGRSFTKN